LDFRQLEKNSREAIKAKAFENFLIQPSALSFSGYSKIHTLISKFEFSHKQTRADFPRENARLKSLCHFFMAEQKHNFLISIICVLLSPGNRE